MTHIRLAWTAFLLPILAAAASGAPTSMPATTRAAATAKAQVPPPARAARTFIQGLEKFLYQEHRNRKTADSLLLNAAAYISDKALETSIAPYGQTLADLSAEEQTQARKDLAGAWAAIIAFYTGHINYRQMKIVAPPNETLPAIIFFPAVAPRFPRPVNVRVDVIQEGGQWKIKYIGLLPEGRAPATTLPAAP